MTRQRLPSLSASETESCASGNCIRRRCSRCARDCPRDARSATHGADAVSGWRVRAISNTGRRQSHVFYPAVEQDQ